MRRSLEFMQSYRYSEPGSIWNHDPTMDEFEGSREFRGIVDDAGAFASSRHRGKLVMESNRPEGATAEEMQKSGLSTFQDADEMVWLTDEYQRQLDQLYKAQKAAGDSKDFNKIFGSRMDPSLYELLDFTYVREACTRSPGVRTANSNHSSGLVSGTGGGCRRGYLAT